MQEVVDSGIYNQVYAERFFKESQQSGYTAGKNIKLAEMMSSAGGGMVIDIGGNVNAVVDEPGSLRHEFDKRGVGYFGLDLSPAYFSADIARQANSSLKTYSDARGVVADGAQMPLRNGAIERFLCADVIEHIPEPDKVFDGAYNALIPGGTFTVVVPTLYKLDALDFPHVNAVRRSSHVNKLLPKEWAEIAHSSGFTLEASDVTPLAMGSGLSYVLWLDGQFITPRKEIGEDGDTTESSVIHKRAKKFIGAHDSEIDASLSRQPELLQALWGALMDADMAQFASLYELALYGLDTGIDKRNEDIDRMLTSIEALDIDDSIMQAFRAGLSDYGSSPESIFGNSSILTLHKPF